MKTGEKCEKESKVTGNTENQQQFFIKPVVDYWNNIYPMPDELVEDIYEVVKVKMYKKGDVLLVPGKVAQYACFVLKGLVKSYYIPEDDISEVITKFLAEESIITSIFSFYSRRPGNEYIVAMEETVVACLHYEDMQRLLNKHPAYNYIIRVITERYLYFLEFELYNMRRPLAEDRYNYFIKHFPGLLQRVPLKDIASYLGMSVETLSRIRGRYRKTYR
jgi:CRP/FNR family transcriptional regulator, anaerobic regulatory protein